MLGCETEKFSVQKAAGYAISEHTSKYTHCDHANQLRTLDG